MWMIGVLVGLYSLSLRFRGREHQCYLVRRALEMLSSRRPQEEGREVDSDWVYATLKGFLSQFSLVGVVLVWDLGWLETRSARGVLY
jgi:hypothetical protein